MHLKFLQMNNRAFTLEIVALLLNSPEREVDGKYIPGIFLIIICNIEVLIHVHVKRIKDSLINFFVILWKCLFLEEKTYSSFFYAQMRVHRIYTYPTYTCTYMYLAVGDVTVYLFPFLQKVPHQR